MGYEYDVFISYKNDNIYGRWVHETFYNLFESCLNQSLGRKSSIFMDKRNINDGDAWPERLKNALAKSKCMVAVFTPLYFNSSWCKRECSIMLSKEEELGYRTVLKPSGLISAIILQDGNRFPNTAKEIQGKEWHDYGRVGAGFEKTERFIELQDKIIPFAENVARIIQTAPPFKKKWLNDKWLETACNKHTLNLSDNLFTKPKL